MRCPVVVLDVDGVLAADPHALPGGYAAVRALGYRAHEFDGLGPDGSHARHGVAQPGTGVWLRELVGLNFSVGVRRRDLQRVSERVFAAL